MILNGKDAFFFHGRSRRPPLDPFNALLSFAYALLANDCAAALEAAGLDSYVGFLHRDRPEMCIRDSGDLLGVAEGAGGVLHPHLKLRARGISAKKVGGHRAVAAGHRVKLHGLTVLGHMEAQTGHGLAGAVGQLDVYQRQMSRRSLSAR